MAVSLGSGLRRRGRGALEATLGRIPLDLWERAFPKDVVALGYHLASDEDLAHLRYYRYKTPTQFEADVRFMRDRAVGYDEIVSVRRNGRTLPANRLLFTADDGFAECASVMAPLLRRHGVPGIFFVTSGFLDDATAFHENTISLCVSAVEAMDDERARVAVAELGLHRPQMAHASDGARSAARVPQARTSAVAGDRRRLTAWLLGLDDTHPSALERAGAVLGVDPAAYVREHPIYLRSEQVAALARDGFTIGAHGVTHRRLGSLSADAIEREIVASCDRVREITGQAKVPFAFPYDGKGVDRGLLHAIAARAPQVDLIFDSGPLKRDVASVVHRVWCDDPTGAAPTGSNVTQRLASAWSRPEAWVRTAVATS